MHRRVHCSSEPGGVRASGTRPHSRIAPAADQSAREREGGKPYRGGEGATAATTAAAFQHPFLPPSVTLFLSLRRTIQDVEGGARFPHRRSLYPFYGRRESTPHRNNVRARRRRGDSARGAGSSRASRRRRWACVPIVGNEIGPGGRNADDGGGRVGKDRGSGEGKGEERKGGGERADLRRRARRRREEVIDPSGRLPAARVLRRSRRARARCLLVCSAFCP